MSGKDYENLKKEVISIYFFYFILKKMKNFQVFCNDWPMLIVQKEFQLLCNISIKHQGKFLPLHYVSSF